LFIPPPHAVSLRSLHLQIFSRPYGVHLSRDSLTIRHISCRWHSWMSSGEDGHLTWSVMALPVSLRVSVTPPELELMASQEIVEIVPLITMERTAFISVVSAVCQNHSAFCWCVLSLGCIWPTSPSKQSQDPSVDGCKSENEKEVSYYCPWLAKCWCVFFFLRTSSFI
jgi:hypothetical protein